MNTKFKLFIIAACLSISVSAFAKLPDSVTLSWAIESGDVVKINEWFIEGMDPDFTATQFGSGLLTAAWYGRIDIMALFVEHGGNVNAINKNGEQALALAAWNNKIDAVKWLLGHGATLNRESNKWGALHYAVFNGHIELTDYLLAQGADVNSRAPNGATPVMLAAREGHADLAKKLLESGADTTLKTDWDDTALTMAMRYSHFKIGQMISSPEDFAIAVKAPIASFGVASRSSASPKEIESLLAKIKEADQLGKSTEVLQTLLTEAITKYKNTMIAKTDNKNPVLKSQPKAIIITAKRGKVGVESARIVLDKPVTSQKTSNSSSDITTILHQLKLAEAQGKPTAELKQKLIEASRVLKP